MYFITPYNLRRPLANILGLISIFDSENLSDEFNIVIINNLKIASEELDKVIYQMNQILEKKRPEAS